MKTLKEIEKMFPDSYRSEDGQKLVLKACDVGNNFYDYGEPEKKLTFYPKFQFLQNDHRIIIEDCSICCGCAGW